MSQRRRPLLVAITAPAAAAVLHAALLPDLVTTVTTSRRPDFATLLETGAALALLLSSLWLAAVTVLVVAQAVLGAPGQRVPSLACPAGVRRAVLAACGLTLATGLLSPATAAPPEPVWPPGPSPEILAEGASGTAPRARLSPLWDLDGLPLPDRISHPTARSLPAPPEGMRARQHRVVAGDTLWSIAGDDLAASASAADISRHVQRIHRHNRAAIGPDPGLIHPGLLLRLPPTTTGKAAP